MTILIDTYGTEALSWAPETLRRELEDDFDVRLPRVNCDKLLAAVLLLTTDEFYWRLSRFIQICNILAGTAFDPYVLDPADAAECAWGMTEAMLLSPPDTEEPFTDEIRHYLGATLDWEGIKTTPDLLRLALRDTPTGLPDWSGMSTESPAMFNAEFDVQADRGREIAQMVHENLRELLQQLSQLQLVNGDTSNLLEKTREHLST